MRAGRALLDIEEFSAQAARYAPKVALALTLLILGVFFTRALRTVVRGLLGRTKMGTSSVHLVSRIAGLVAWVLVITVVLSTLQLQAVVFGISGALALMGAAFVASAAGISNDIISGFFLAADPDIDVGDRIQAAGVEGVVRDIDFRKTRIVDDDGRLHVLPNRLIENGEWVVLRRGPGAKPH